MQTTIRVTAVSVLLLTLLGCAAPPAKKDPRDPWERMNRTTYKFNDKVDKGVLRPLARGYQKVTPDFFRTGVSNFFDNLGYPVVIVNDLLQGEIHAGGQGYGPPAHEHDLGDRGPARSRVLSGSAEELERLRTDTRALGRRERPLRGDPVLRAIRRA